MLLSVCIVAVLKDVCVHRDDSLCILCVFLKASQRSVASECFVATAAAAGASG